MANFRDELASDVLTRWQNPWLVDKVSKADAATPAGHWILHSGDDEQRFVEQNLGFYFLVDNPSGNASHKEIDIAVAQFAVQLCGPICPHLEANPWMPSGDSIDDTSDKPRRDDLGLRNS